MLNAYLTACAYFYYIIELKSAYKVITNSLSKSSMKNLWRDYNSFKREARRSAAGEEVLYKILTEADLYEDGKNVDILIYCPYLNAPQISRNTAASGVVVLPPGLGIKDRTCLYPVHSVSDADADMERLYTLDEIRCRVLEKVGHYIPDDILSYTEPDYIEETDQTRAMEEFLRKCEVKGGGLCEDERVHKVMVDMVDIIRDVCIRDPFQSALQMLMEFYEMKIIDPRDASGSYKKIVKFAELFNNLQNYTRVPRNCGFTAEEMIKMLQK